MVGLGLPGGSQTYPGFLLRPPAPVPGPPFEGPSIVREALRTVVFQAADSLPSRPFFNYIESSEHSGVGNDGHSPGYLPVKGKKRKHALGFVAGLPHAAFRGFEEWPRASLDAFKVE